MSLLDTSILEGCVAPCFDRVAAITVASRLAVRHLEGFATKNRGLTRFPLAEGDNGVLFTAGNYGLQCTIPNAQLHLLLAETHQLSEWRVAVAGQHLVYFSVFALIVQGYVECHSTYFGVSIRTLRNGQKVRYDFVWDGHAWGVFGEPLEFRPRGIVVFDQGNSFVIDPEVTRGLEVSSVGRHVFGLVLAEALSLIERADSRTAAWVSAVLKGVVLVEFPQGMTSASSAFRLGIVSASMPHSPEQLAMQLVHESAHQYFLAYEHIERFSDQSDERLYSPLAGCDRPTGRVLLAFHAVVNMLLLYRHLDAAGVSSNYLRRTHKRLLASSQRCVEDLNRSFGLTPAGRDFLALNEVSLNALL